MRIFGRNVIHGSDSPENGKREIGNVTIGSTVILHSGHNSSSNISHCHASQSPDSSFVFVCF